MMRAGLVLLAGCIFALLPAVGQTPKGSRECSADQYRVNDLFTYAELKEQRLPEGSTDYVNPGTNGSIRVHGWTNADVLVRACVHTAAASEAEARGMVSQISIARGAGQIEPIGPSESHNERWDISYEIWVPVSANLKLEAHNGSISVDGVRGQTHFHTENGSLHLSGVAGDVDGSTENGSVTIDLEGTGWNGQGLHAETTNGSVHLVIPHNFSAQVQASTVNGKLRIEFPVTMQGEIGTNTSFQLGSGGPLIEAKTVNGSVTISRKS
jgi:DUF4097 and DUF4098 domain-containing protein YvlB